MRWKTFALMVTAGLIAPALIVPTLAQQRGGRERLLDRECRREIVKLCGLNRSEMRSCLRERGDRIGDLIRSVRLAHKNQGLGGEQRPDVAVHNLRDAVHFASAKVLLPARA